MTTADYEPVKVLAVSPAEHDKNCLRRVLGHTFWTLWPASTIAEALDVIRKNRIAVVVTSERLPDGNWRDLLAQIHNLPETPELILMCTDDDRLWSEALERGAYDVLAKPLQNSEVFRIISLAWRQWRDQLRDPAATVDGSKRVANAIA